MATNSIKLLTGNSHPQLAKLVADRLGIELAKTMSLNYSNQETSVTVGESVRDEDGNSAPSLPANSSDTHPQYSSCNPLPQATSTTG
jgi:phosphoribosylpyrophosphate synthetase